MSLTQRVHDYWNAESCGTRYINEVKFTRAYFEGIESYRYENAGFIHEYAQFTRWHGKRVLEVGVGAGTDFLQWVRAGAIASGVDLTEEGVEHIKRRLELYGLSADVRVANAEALPFEDNTFDLVYSYGVIHCAENTEKAFQEIMRVAKPGARMKIMIYNIVSPFALYWWLRYGIWRGRGPRWAVSNYVESPGTKGYSEREFGDLIERNGGRVLSVRYDEQAIRPDARWRTFRRLVRALSLRRWFWFMSYEIEKPR